MPMFKVLKNVKNYALICRLRNDHRIDAEEELEFIRDCETSKSRSVQCLDCGFDLELKWDENNPEFYDVIEI